MYVYETDTLLLDPWLRQEITLTDRVEAGMRGEPVRKVQEWLTLRGYPLAIDGIFGVATAETVARFQEDSFLPSTGRVDLDTFARLSEPMLDTLRQRLLASRPLGDAIVTYAQAHLIQHPHEVGGQNRGPWVRMYMRGHDGVAWPWCAGFVSFAMHQAAQSMELPAPIPGSFSCDVLAGQAKAAGLFVGEDAARHRQIPPGSIFLNRRTDTDWTHTGIVVEANELTFTTIEGNTNDEGSREGYEVCMRTRAYADRDFIVFD